LKSIKKITSQIRKSEIPIEMIPQRILSKAFGIVFLLSSSSSASLEPFTGFRFETQQDGPNMIDSIKSKWIMPIYP
jgi:hypothetical protein